jgi:putative membrane protein
MNELMRRSARATPSAAPWLAVVALAALSSFFQIVEAVVAQLVHPELGAAYLGTQGDMWDAQKDIEAAFCGAPVMAIILVLRSRRT